MKKIRKMLSVVIAVVIVLAMSASAFAASTTGNSAKSIALKNAKLSKKQVERLRVKYDDDDARYEVKFIKKKNGAKYEYEIGKRNGKIYEKSIEYRVKWNGSSKKIGKTAARKAAAKKAGVKLSVVKNGVCKYDYDDGEGVYEIEFRKGNKEFDIDVQAATGKILEYSWEYMAW